MEHMTKPTLADDYLHSLLTQLPLVEARGEDSKEYLAQKTKEIKWYLRLRMLMKSTGNDSSQVKEEKATNPGLVDKFDAVFGATSLEELGGLVEAIKNIQID